MKLKKLLILPLCSIALASCSSVGFKEVYGQSSDGNIASSKVIENNGGIFLYEENGSKYYKIVL